MRNFKVGDWVTISKISQPSNARHLDIREGDVGVVRSVWYNGLKDKHGCYVELSAFHTDIILEDLRKDDEFDENLMAYPFFEEELILSTECEKEENNILEV